MKCMSITIFQLQTMVTLLLFSCGLVQASQVITEEHRTWAKQIVKHEGKIAGEATAPNSIAILNVTNNSDRARINTLRKGLALMLTSDLEKVEQIQVTERVRVQAMLDEMALGDSGIDSAEDSLRAGKLLGVYYTTSGSIMADSTDNLKIDLSLYEVPFDQIGGNPSSVGALAELAKLEKEILFQILQLMNIEITPEKRAELEVPLSNDTDALLDLFQGIDYSDKGQYGEATVMYKQALMKDPDLEMAASALQELKEMGLMAGAEEIPMLEEGPAPPEAEEGLSMGTKIGIGAAAVAAIGAGAYIYSEQDDDDPPPDPNTLVPPSIASMTPAEGTTLDCLSGTVSFVFSEPMLRVGTVYITANDSNLDHFFNVKASWDDQWDDVNFSISWVHSLATGQHCQDDPTKVVINITLSNFQDLQGNALTGKKRFTFYGTKFVF